MAAVLVRAIEKTYYGGRDRPPGEEYSMDSREHSEINVLCLLRKIERVADAPTAVQSAPAAQPAPLYKTTAVEAEGDEGEKDQGEEAPAGDGEEAAPRRRRYNRRDMRPEK